MTYMLFTTVLLATVVISWLGVRFLIHFLVQRDIVDVPNERTLHDGAIARGGGLVIVACLLTVLIVVAFVTGRWSMFIGLALVVVCWGGLSWRDDKHDLTPKIRFITQLCFSILTLLAFGWITEVQLTSQIWIPLSWFGALITLVGVLWVANLYNFMDGMDGLAASQTIIAGTTLGFWFWQAGDVALALVCGVLAAASYGFLFWNWQPAKIFMGDVGSVTIGAFFATLVIIGVNRYQFPVISCGVLFAVFAGDASITLLHRMLRREKFWLAHRRHYYQRLAALGFEHKKIVIAAIVLMLLCSLIASASVLYRDIVGLAMLMAIALLLAVMSFVVFLEKSQQNK